MASWGDEITPFTLVWWSSRISMRQRSSVTDDECIPIAEKMCKLTEANVPKPRSAFSTDGINARWILVAVRKEFSKAKRPSSYWARREALSPPRVDASTTNWRVSQGLKPLPVQAGSREGFRSLALFTNFGKGREDLNWALPTKTWQHDGRPNIGAWLRVTSP